MGYNLQKLRELTMNLPNFADLVNGGNVDYTEYKMEVGTCWGWHVFQWGDSIGVHRWFNSKGTKFPKHAHPQKEWIIVYEGSMYLTRDDGKVKVSQGSSCYLPPNLGHGAEFEEDCYYITITIPVAEEFPIAKQRK